MLPVDSQALRSITPPTRHGSEAAHFTATLEAAKRKGGVVTSHKDAGGQSATAPESDAALIERVKEARSLRERAASLGARAVSLQESIYALGTSGGYAPQVMQKELDTVKAEHAKVEADLKALQTGPNIDELKEKSFELHSEISDLRQSTGNAPRSMYTQSELVDRAIDIQEHIDSLDGIPTFNTLAAEKELSLVKRAIVLQDSIDALGSSGGSATQAMQKELDGLLDDLKVYDSPALMYRPIG